MKGTLGEPESISQPENLTNHEIRIVDFADVADISRLVRLPKPCERSSVELG